jgi:hypothetical protein
MAWSHWDQAISLCMIRLHTKTLIRFIPSSKRAAVPQKLSAGAL